MRLLFATWAWRSHLFPMVPLAWACRAAGHDVRVATQPSLLDEVSRSGLPAVPVGRDVAVPDIVRNYVLRPAGAPAAAAAPGPPRVLGMLLALAEAMVDDLAEFACDWKPDVVVHDPTTLAGPLAAAVAGRPAVRHLYGLDLLHSARAALAGAFAPLCERLGVDHLERPDTVTVDPCPAGLQVPTDYTPRRVRYVPYNGPGRVPGCLPRQRRRPRVCVTWGTTMARLDPQLFLTGPVADALGWLDVEVVAAVTRGQRSLLAAQRSTVQVAESVPLHLLLPSCDLVVHHGGAGTLLTALTSGLPQLVIPQLPDHAMHGRRLAGCGAGAVLPRAEATPDRIRETVETLLGTPAARNSARCLERDIAAQPPPAGIVGALEDLATG